MATKFKLNDCVPCIAIHPGEIIKDELDAREMKQKELASFMGMPTSVLNDIILHFLSKKLNSYFQEIENQYPLNNSYINDLKKRL